MDGPRDCCAEWSQTQTNIIWYQLYVESKKKNKQKQWYKWTYLQNRNRITDVENKILVTKGQYREELFGRLELTYTDYYI